MLINATYIEGVSLRLSWSKAVSIPAQPIYIPKHLLEGSNQRYLIKYNKHDDNLCF